MLERQLAGFAWGEMAREAPTRAQLLGEMLAAGFLAGSPFYPTCAHTVEDTERYAAAVDRVFAGLAATRARGKCQNGKTGAKRTT